MDTTDLTLTMKSREARTADHNSVARTYFSRPSEGRKQPCESQSEVTTMKTTLESSITVFNLFHSKVWGLLKEEDSILQETNKLCRKEDQHYFREVDVMLKKLEPIEAKIIKMTEKLNELGSKTVAIVDVLQATEGVQGLEVVKQLVETSLRYVYENIHKSVDIKALFYECRQREELCLESKALLQESYLENQAIRQQVEASNLKMIASIENVWQTIDDLSRYNKETHTIEVEEWNMEEVMYNSNVYWPTQHVVSRSLPEYDLCEVLVPATIVYVQIEDYIYEELNWNFSYIDLQCDMENNDYWSTEKEIDEIVDLLPPVDTILKFQHCSMDIVNEKDVKKQHINVDYGKPSLVFTSEKFMGNIKRATKPPVPQNFKSRMKNKVKYQNECKTMEDIRARKKPKCWILKRICHRKHHRKKGDSVAISRLWTCGKHKKLVPQNFKSRRKNKSRYFILGKHNKSVLQNFKSRKKKTQDFGPLDIIWNYLATTMDLARYIG